MTRQAEKDFVRKFSATEKNAIAHALKKLVDIPVGQHADGFAHLHGPARTATGAMMTYRASREIRLAVNRLQAGRWQLTAIVRKGDHTVYRSES